MYQVPVRDFKQYKPKQTGTKKILKGNTNYLALVGLFLLVLVYTFYIPFFSNKPAVTEKILWSMESKQGAKRPTRKAQFLSNKY